MKRSANLDNEPKRRRTGDWVPATQTRNYLMKDPLLDFLSQPKSKGSHRETKPFDFDSFVMKKGLEFEKLVIDSLRSRYPIDFVDIGAQKDPSDDSYVQATRREMIKGTPFIYSGLVLDDETKTFGIPDLIVRSDWISKLASIPPLSRSSARVPAPLIDAPDYHYRIVDIKFSTLNLRADGVHVLNSGCLLAYKGQLWIYTRALGKLQGYLPDSAYLLGRKWKFICRGITHSGSGCDQVLGTVNFTSIDKDVVSKTDEAVKWIRDVKEHSQEWSLDSVPLPRKELYPNMSNTHDGPFHSFKVEFANRIGEITKMWMCSVSNREYAHSQGIFSLFDSKVSAKTLGLKGKKVAPIVDAIIKVNSPTYSYPTLPSSFEKLPKLYRSFHANEFFIDFEFFNDIFGEIQIPISKSSEMIFMIGIGWWEDHHFCYESFTAKKICPEEEKRICTEFQNFLSKIDTPRVYHWSHAESTQWSRACKRLMLSTSKTLEWVDLLNLFRTEPITVKGCFDFSLKSVTKALASHSLIPDLWSGLSVSNGVDAMYHSYQALQSQDLDKLHDIERYNQQDCRALAELLKMIRS